MAPGLVGGVCATSPQLLGQRYIRWTQELWQALRPYGTDGVYVNNIGREEEDETDQVKGVRDDHAHRL